jgi:hypothetical protein
MPLKPDREILQNSTPEEPKQSASAQNADLEGAAGGAMSKVPQPLNTPRLKVQS